MIKVIQTTKDVNISGYIDRVEKTYSVKHERINYKHINHPIPVQKPEIEDLNSLVVVHDSMEVLI